MKKSVDFQFSRQSAPQSWRHTDPVTSLTELTEGFESQQGGVLLRYYAL